MKFTIHGFRNSVLTQLGLSDTDALVLRACYDRYKRGRTRIYWRGTEDYFWVDYPTLLHYLGCLSITCPKTLSRWFARYVRAGVLKSLIGYRGDGGRQACFHFVPVVLEMLLSREIGEKEPAMAVQEGIQVGTLASLPDGGVGTPASPLEYSSRKEKEYSHIGISLRDLPPDADGSFVCSVLSGKDFPKTEERERTGEQMPPVPPSGRNGTGKSTGSFHLDGAGSPPTLGLRPEVAALIGWVNEHSEMHHRLTPVSHASASTLDIGPSKTLLAVQNKLLAIKTGTFYRTFDLDREWEEKQEVPRNGFNKPLSWDELSAAVRKAILRHERMRQEGTWPANKKYLARSFNDFLYNGFTHKSWFLYCHTHPLKPLPVASEERARDTVPVTVQEIVRPLYEQMKTNGTVSETGGAGFWGAIKQVLAYWEDNVEDWKATDRTESVTWSYVGTRERFFARWAQFYLGWGRKISVRCLRPEGEGNTWRRFVSWVKETQGVELGKEVKGTAERKGKEVWKGSRQQSDPEVEAVARYLGGG